MGVMDIRKAKQDANRDLYDYVAKCAVIKNVESLEKMIEKLKSTSGIPVLSYRGIEVNLAFSKNPEKFREEIIQMLERLLVDHNSFWQKFPAKVNSPNTKVAKIYDAEGNLMLGGAMDE